MKIDKTVYFMLAAQFVLLVPAIGMVVSSEIDWDMRDFAIASILLAGFGFAFSLLANRTNNKKQLVIGLALTAIIFLVWAELAVGIFDTPFAGS